MTMKGMMIAASVAGLFATLAPAPAHAEGGKVICEGINACKGQGSCAGPGHGCAGQNGCKGQGHSKVGSKDECLKKGGKIVEAKK